jgi:hypothetical protein
MNSPESVEQVHDRRASRKISPRLLRGVTLFAAAIVLAGCTGAQTDQVERLITAGDVDPEAADLCDGAFEGLVQRTDLLAAENSSIAGVVAMFEQLQVSYANDVSLVNGQPDGFAAICVAGGALADLGRVEAVMFYQLPAPAARNFICMIAEPDAPCVGH